MKWFSVALLVGLLAACGGKPPEWSALKQEIRERFPGVEHVSVDEFSSFEASDEVLLIDVREPEEFAVSHLQHAINLTDPDAIMALIDQHGPEKVVLYCSVGYRSSAMAARLQAAGVEAVYNLEGSLFEWANQGRETFAAESPVVGVHPYDDTWGQLLERSLWAWQPVQNAAPAE